MHPMCGRYTFTFDAKTLGQAFDMVPPGFRVERSYNLCPGKWVIVVRPDQDQLAADLAQWGLVPTWAKDPKAGPRPINARAEGIATKPTFRAAFRHGRCLVPASGFYEWKTEGKHKQPFYIRPRGGEGLFVFAGLFSQWTGPDGELKTCAIITTAANDLMAAIHDRMPVILASGDQPAWLDPENGKAAELLRPFNSEAMEAYPVGLAVGNPKNDGPELIERIEA